MRLWPQLERNHPRKRLGRVLAAIQTSGTRAARLTRMRNAPGPDAQPSTAHGVDNAFASCLPPPDPQAHLALVWRVARQVARRLPSSVGVEELVGAGTMGLMGALSRYEETRSGQFSSYAEIRIRGAILDQLREMDWMPRSVRSKRKQLDAVRLSLQQNLGRPPNLDEIADALGIAREAAEHLRTLTEDIDLIAFEADHEPPDEALFSQPGFLLEERELRRRVAGALAALPARFQEVVRLYYVEQKRQREIGEMLGVSESRVCQILREAVCRLRSDLAPFV
jgi:RNA polymerase sigma factor for flagellar operon FliA